VLFKNEALKGDEYFLHVGMYFFWVFPETKNMVHLFSIKILLTNNYIFACLSSFFIVLIKML
jgi:hypothetical protein